MPQRPPRDQFIT